MTHTHSKSVNPSIAVIAILAALAVLGVVAVTLVTIPLQIQQAEAKGCPTSTPGINASKGRCFGHGP
jgi:uncharacterized membrane protein YjgN (DUF898 family)